MKTSIRFSLLFFLALCLSFLVTAQQENFPVIQENGQRFYLYSVKPQEGLFSLAREFNISQAEILAYNPSVTSALQVGQQIKIPINDQTTALRSHTVTKKQTLYSIAYLYGTTVEAIVALNPEAEKGIKDGEILVIPPAIPKELKSTVTINNVVSNKSPKVNKGTIKPEIKKTGQFITHQVVAGETFYSLSREYKVTVDAIREANPDVSELKTGTTVRIPFLSSLSPLGHKTIVQQTQKLAEEAFEHQPDLYNKSTKVIKIGMLLPFSVDGVKVDGTIDKFVDFYQGALLALLKAKKEGISIQLYAYDIEKSDDILLPLLTKESPLWHVDFIIGPAYAGQVQAISSFAKQHKIYTVIPFSSQVHDIAYNPYLIQFNPSVKWQCDTSASLFARQFRNYNIVIGNLDTATDPSGIGRMFTSSLTQRLNSLRIPFKNVALANGNVGVIQPLLSRTKPNIIVLGDDNVDNVIPYLRNIGPLAYANNMSVYGFPDWDPEQGIYPKLYYTSLFFVNNPFQLSQYDNALYQWFRTRITPSNGMRYDLLGYDITNYFVDTWEHSGNQNVANQLIYPPKDNLQSQFHFHKVSPEGGWVNEEMNLLYYSNDNGIQRVSQSMPYKK